MSHKSKKFLSNELINLLRNNILFRYLYLIILISKIIVSYSQIRNLEPAPYITLKAKSSTSSNLNVLGPIFKSSRKRLCPMNIFVKVKSNEEVDKKSTSDCTYVSINSKERILGGILL